MMKCATHPGVETGLTCVTCGTPICPDCLVQTPAGMKCRRCGVGPVPRIYRVSPGRLALAVAAGAAGGAVAGAAVLLPGASGFGLLIVLLGPVAGALVGHAVGRAAGDKRGMTVAITAAASCAVGIVLVAPQLLVAAQGGLPVPVLELVAWISRRPFFLLFALVATLAAYWRVR